MAALPADFVLPAIYSVPPFFTLQPTDASRAVQLAQWSRLVLAWCAHHRQTSLVLARWPLFENAVLRRRLSDEGVAAVAAALVAAGSAEWADAATRTTLRVFFRAPAEWAALLLSYMRDAGRTGAGGSAQAFATVHELRGGGGAGDASSPCTGLDAESVARALEVLEAEGQVAIISSGNGDLDQMTVRFL